MDFDELLKQRYSCRNYKKMDVSKEDIEKIVNAGRISPSARNSQPCEYYVLNNSEKNEELKEYLMKPGFNKFVGEVSCFIVLVLTKEAYEFKKAGTKRDFTDIDAGIACHALCLEATSLGLATCIMGGFDHDGVAKLVGIEEVDRIKLVISIGVSNDESIQDKNERRKEMKEVINYL